MSYRGNFSVIKGQLTDGIRIPPDCIDRSTAGAVYARRYLRGADGRDGKRFLLMHRPDAIHDVLGDVQEIEFEAVAER